MIKINWNYHCHTHYTDGRHTVEEIAEYCAEQGVEEIAVTEHVSKKLTYDFDSLLSDIARVRREYRVRIITGAEAKILPDGSLDCPDGIKKNVDILIGSVHGLNGMSEQEAYEKLAASDCMIIGHPRYFNDAVIAALVRTRKIVELSGRYEQPDAMIMAFRDAGLLFSIGLDSHELRELDAFQALERRVERLGLRKRLWRFPH